jgi:hypothetical protein
MHLANWVEVCDVMDCDASGNPVDFGIAEWWFLPHFLEQQLIKPGEHGWHGPGTLVDVRILPSSALDSSWRWYFDFEPCLSYLNAEAGYIVCPPFFHADWRDTTLRSNGIVYVFDTGNEQPSRQRKWSSRPRSRMPCRQHLGQIRK